MPQCLTLGRRPGLRIRIRSFLSDPGLEKRSDPVCLKDRIRIHKDTSMTNFRKARVADPDPSILVGAGL